MKKENITWAIIIAIIIIGVGGYLVLNPAPETPTGPASGPGGEEPAGEPGEPMGPGGEEGPVEPEVPQWQDPVEPESSAPMELGDVPVEALKITMTAEGISPSTFEVKKGAKVMISVTSGDKWTHVFKFRDESLAEAAVGVAPNETRVITFYAPSSSGEYEYYCDLPGHASRGEVGTMIVK